MSFLRRHSVLSQKLEPETFLTISRMTSKPSMVDRLNYDQFIKEVKVGHGLEKGANNLNTIFRMILMNACHHSQVNLLNWVSNGFDGEMMASYGTPGGTLSHTPYKHSSVTVSGNHIKVLQEVLITAYMQNFTGGHYHYDDAVGYSWGSGQSNGNYNLLSSRTSPTFFTRISQAGANVTGTITAPAPGLFSCKRTGNTVSVWHNTTQLASTNGVNLLGSLLPTGGGLGVFATHRNGDLTQAGIDSKCSMHFLGSFEVNLSVMKSAIENYMAKYP